MTGIVLPDPLRIDETLLPVSLPEVSFFKVSRALSRGELRAEPDLALSVVSEAA